MEKIPSPFKVFMSDIASNKGAMIGLFFVFIFFCLALLAPLIAPYDPTVLNESFFRLPPIWSEGSNPLFILGTDDVGRDLLSRLIYGARVSLGVGLSVVLLSLLMGIPLGLLSGFYGGFVDKLIMRIMDILMALPSILLSIVVVAILGPGLNNAVIAVALVAVPGLTRVVRASVMNEKHKQYIMAAQIFGRSNLGIMIKEILPNCAAPLIVQATLGFSEGILNAAALGFLGLGAQPPTPEWGTMLSDSRSFIESSPWMVTLPGLCILIVVLGFNLFGDGLRDALDPRLKRV